jgi:hypothetical protein
MTSATWMKPPSVNELTSPKSHSITRTTPMIRRILAMALPFPCVSRFSILPWTDGSASPFRAEATAQGRLVSWYVGCSAPARTGTRFYLSTPAEDADRQQQPDDSRCDAAKDVPHRVLRKMAGKKVAHAVSQRAGRSCPYNDQDSSDDQQDYSNAFRYVHRLKLLKMPERINEKCHCVLPVQSSNRDLASSWNFT